MGRDFDWVLAVSNASNASSASCVSCASSASSASCELCELCELGELDEQSGRGEQRKLGALGEIAASPETSLDLWTVWPCVMLNSPTLSSSQALPLATLIGESADPLGPGTGPPRLPPPPDPPTLAVAVVVAVTVVVAPSPALPAVPALPAFPPSPTLAALAALPTLPTLPAVAVEVVAKTADADMRLNMRRECASTLYRMAECLLGGRTGVMVGDGGGGVTGVTKDESWARADVPELREGTRQWQNITTRASRFARLHTAR